MLPPVVKIYDSNCKRVSRRALDKVQPGEMFSFDKMGTQVWNEDIDYPSGSQSQGLDEQVFDAVQEQAPAEEPLPCNADVAEQPLKSAQITAKPAGNLKGERRLNLSISHTTGEQRCIKAMKAIENKGEGQFLARAVIQKEEGESRLRSTCHGGSRICLCKFGSEVK